VKALLEMREGIKSQIQMKATNRGKDTETLLLGVIRVEDIAICAVVIRQAPRRHQLEASGDVADHI
jgi:hypothetical protein